MDWMTWYDGLAKPTWTPVPPTIGTIWQILYPIILVTFGFVFVQAAQGPYFAWVSIATVLQLSTTAMNWGKP